MSNWDSHPGVRSDGQLTRGERAADVLRNAMGSWGFVGSALGFLGVWMALNIFAIIHHWDPYPFVLLNLVLSCLAALQGAILLIAAKRSDQISSELAHHDFETNQEALAILHRMDVEMIKRMDKLDADMNLLASRFQSVVIGTDPNSRAAKKCPESCGCGKRVIP